MNKELASKIAGMGYKMTLDDVRSGFVSVLIKNEIEDLILCMAGCGRSPAAVELLMQYGILAIALAEGYNGLTYLGHRDKVFKELKKFRRISTVFTYDEKNRINGQYFGLKIFQNYEHHTQTLTGLSVVHTTR